MREDYCITFKDEIKKIKSMYRDVLDREENELNSIAQIIFKVEFIFYLAIKVNEEQQIYKTTEHIRKAEFSPFFNLYGNISNKSKHYISLISMISQWNVKDIMEKDLNEYIGVGKYLYININKNDIYEEIFISKDMLNINLGKKDRSNIYEGASEKIIKNIIYNTKDLSKYANKKYFVKFGDKINPFNNREFEILINSSKSSLIDINYSSKKNVNFTLREIIKAAEHMDKLLLEESNWKERIENLEFIKYSNKAFKVNKLNIHDTQNWVGLLNVGKTTLMKVIAFNNFQKNITSTLVLKDNVEIYETVDLFNRLGINAIPLTSDANRKKIFKDVVTSKINNSQDIANIFNNKSFEHLSQNCPLKEYLDDNDKGTYELTGTLCPYIYCYYKDSKGKEIEERISCPLYNKCDFYKAKKSLNAAKIYLTTVSALIYGLTEKEIYKEKMSYLEYVYKVSDLIMFDEADSVQQIVDNIFIPLEDLINGNESTIEYLYKTIPNIFRNRRGKISNELQNWERELLQLNSLVIGIYSGLVHTKNIFVNIVKSKNNLGDEKITKKYPDLFKMLSKSTFNAQKTFNILAYFINVNCKENDELNDKELIVDNTKELEAMQKTIERFNELIYFYKHDKDSEFSDLVNLASSDEEYFERKAKKYWDDLLLKCKISEDVANNQNFNDSLLTLFKIGLYILAFEKLYGKILTKHYNVKSELKSLNITDKKINESLMLFNKLREYDSVLPIAPIGTEIGFTLDGEKGNEVLKLFKYLNNGRYLLYKLHQLYEDIDLAEGPKVILFSGTSFAPESSKFHIDMDVNYVIKRKGDLNIHLDYEAKMLINDKNKLIRISGLSGFKLEEAIKNMGYALTKSLGDTPCMLERMLSELDSHRKRLMIIMGSYEESRMLKDSIVSNYKGDILKIAALNEDVKRSDLVHFANNDYNILIAPMLAVHRGHNILTVIEDEPANEEERFNEIIEKNIAAFGAIAYGKRPYPKPHVLSDLASLLNSSAIKHLLYDKDDDIKTTVNRIIKESKELFKRFYDQKYYLDLSDNERTRLIANIAVDTNQLEGRLIRGDVGAKVFWLDGAFFPHYENSEINSNETSMLLGLRDYYINTSNELKGKDKYIFDELYGYRIEAFRNMKGLR
ncbi:hypothetical protein [Clostridium beijerinckii]|uniref:Uncharacterized protein n=1 Tax=Clostridium beijerinckii TaxID=1520 RepID=A0A1S9N6K5_CLOBE|nr:hypothetical protein [Clostridium beijerinckii]OOP73197.1 hypothetical protein CBEIBR21_09175 [Clostridium beijerinckii]